MKTESMEAKAMTEEQDLTTDDNQFVTFTLDEETYGVEITRVQEIIGYRGFTKIPNVSEYVRGVLNLRGTVVPAIDLRTKFKLKPKEYDRYTVIIIVEVAGRTMGVIVDSVSDVVSLKDNEIQPTPAFSSKIRTDFINGMAKQDDKFIILLDIDKVLSQDELQELENAV